MSADIQFQLQAILRFLLTPWGILAVLAMPMLVIGLIGSDRLKWIFLAVLLWLSTFGIIERTPWFNSILISPLQELRSLGKGFAIIIMTMMVPAALFSVSTWRTRRVGGAVVTFFVFELIITTRQMAAGFVVRSAVQYLMFGLVFLIVGVGLGNWLRTLDDVRKAFKSITWAALLLVAGSLIQVVVDSHQVVQVSRLLGTTSNPQFLGSMLAMAITPVLYLLLTSTEKITWRLTLGALLGFMMVCLIWTGSRTALLMASVNVLLFLRLRVGRIIAAVTVACASFYVAMSLFPASVAIVDRLFSSADTRSAVFHQMIAQFLRNPFMGAISSDVRGYQENAYLAVAAQFGLMGIIPMVIAMITITLTLRKLQKIRPQLGKYAGMADVVTGVTVCLGMGSMFDAYPLAAIGFHVFVLYIVLTIADFLLDYVAATSTQVVADPATGMIPLPQAA